MESSIHRMKDCTVSAARLYQTSLRNTLNAKIASACQRFEAVAQKLECTCVHEDFEQHPNSDHGMHSIFAKKKPRNEAGPINTGRDENTIHI